MHDGIESRIIIHDILKLIKIKSINFDEALILATKNKKVGPQNNKFIYNVVLTTLRKSIIINKIIKKLVKKINPESDSYILLLSSISQILYLNIKDYAVVNSTVEISKKKNMKTSTSLINATLRNFLRKKFFFTELKISFTDLPNWLKNHTNNLSQKEKNNLLNNIFDQPSIHLVFKKNELAYFTKFGKKTSNNSLAIDKKYNFNDIPNYNEGSWWVQDFSSMLPLSIMNIDKFQNIVDVGSAPGGKLFQLLRIKKDIASYEKNKLRAKRLKENLRRLKFKFDTNIKDFIEIDESKKFDLIVLDAPCSSIGTIRRNPEIFFKKKSPNFHYLLNTQYNLLEKSKKILKKNGILLYMVCSFLENETTEQIKKFLKKNNNFSIDKFDQNINKLSNEIINKKGFILTYPKTILDNVKIDGYFASKLIKNAD